MINGNYTIVLKTLLDDPGSKALIDKALSTYPLYTAENEARYTRVMTREELNKRILDYYKYREIGFETFGRFLDELEISMNEIMPYYNQLFTSEDIINGLEDLFGNLDVKETFEEETTGSGSTESSSTSTDDQNVSATSKASGSTEHSSNTQNTNKNVKSDTPQSTINIEDQTLLHHASEAEWNKGSSDVSEESSNENEAESETISVGTSNTSGTGTTQTSGTTKHTLTRKGNQGVNTYAHDMVEFRNIFINIVQKIIHDPRIEELFMGVF